MAVRWLGGEHSTVVTSSIDFDVDTVAKVGLPFCTVDLSDIIGPAGVAPAAATPIILQWVVILGWPLETHPGEPQFGLRIKLDPADGCASTYQEGVHGMERIGRIPGIYVAHQCKPIVHYQLEVALWTSTGDDTPYNQLSYATLVGLAAKR